jgi:site-specific DNA recombinase
MVLMNIAIYARVSSETQAKDGTIDSQIEALRDYAKTHGLTIIREFLDDGYSGTNLDRPGLDQLRDFTQEGLIEGILILSPDRLSRKQTNQIILMEEFKKRNIQVIFTNQQFGDSPEDQLMLQIQGSLAEYERAKILDRTRRGTKHAVRKGQVLGANAPFGFRFIHKADKTPAHWEINPQEAEIVRKIYNLYLGEGLKGVAIAKRLEEEGIPSRSGYSRWWPSVVFSILKSPTYTGIAYMYKTKGAEPKKSPKLKQYRRSKNSSKQSCPQEDWISIPVERIIDQKTWEAAQTRIKQNVMHSKRNNTKNDYLLRGLVVCGLCGSMASGRVSNRYSYYDCNTKKNWKITGKHHEEKIAINRRVLDQKVWEGLTGLLDDPEKLHAQLQARLEKKNFTPALVSPSSDKTEKELEKLNYQERRIVDAYRESVITLEELKQQKATLASNRKVLEAKIKAAQNHLESSRQPEITMEMLGDVSARYHRVMAKADFEKKQKITNLLVNSVTLFPNRAVVAGIIPVSSVDALIPSNRGTTEERLLSPYLGTGSPYLWVWRRSEPNQ